MQLSSILKTLAGATLLTSALISCTQKEEVKKPNLLFIFPDEWRGSALGFLEKEPVKTPNLDRFAKQGVVLTHAVSTYPVCVPYRTMLMSGKYSQTNGVITNTFADKKEMPDSTKWLSDVLKEQGYDLGYLGKWHITRPVGDCYGTDSLKGSAKRWIKIEDRHGFDYFIMHSDSGHMTSYYWDSNDGPNDYKSVGKWTAEFDTENAIRYIKNEKGDRDENKPFALFVSMHPPHMPYNNQ